MWIVRLVAYARLKFLAAIIRTVVSTEIWVRRNILRTLIDWELAYPRVSRVYTIPSNERSSGDITVRRTVLPFVCLLKGGGVLMWDLNWALDSRLGSAGRLPCEGPSSSAYQLSRSVSFVEICVCGSQADALNLGSGYLIPSLGNDSDFCELLSKKLGITVLDCDYAKVFPPPVPFHLSHLTYPHSHPTGPRAPLSTRLQPSERHPLPRARPTHRLRPLQPHNRRLFSWRRARDVRRRERESGAGTREGVSGDVLSGRLVESTGSAA